MVYICKLGSYLETRIKSCLFVITPIVYLKHLFNSLGSDKTAAVFNKDDEQVVAIFKGHSKKVNRVIYQPSGENTVITASYDATIRIWDVPTSQVIYCTGMCKILKLN